MELFKTKYDIRNRKAQLDNLESEVNKCLERIRLLEEERAARGDELTDPQNWSGNVGVLSDSKIKSLTTKLNHERDTLEKLQVPVPFARKKYEIAKSEEPHKHISFFEKEIVGTATTEHAKEYEEYKKLKEEFEAKKEKVGELYFQREEAKLALRTIKKIFNADIIELLIFSLDEAIQKHPEVVNLLEKHKTFAESISEEIIPAIQKKKEGDQEEIQKEKVKQEKERSYQKRLMAMAINWIKQDKCPAELFSYRGNLDPDTLKNYWISKSINPLEDYDKNLRLINKGGE